MHNGQEGEDRLIQELKAEWDRVDRIDVNENVPSLAALENLAASTRERSRRRMIKELLLFLTLASLLVSGMVLTALNRPGLLLVIHGLSMLIGAVILTAILKPRERRGRHE